MTATLSQPGNGQRTDNNDPKNPPEDDQRAPGNKTSALEPSQSRDQDHSCPTTEDVHFADHVESFLLESAFAIAGFDEACICLLNQKLGNSSFNPLRCIISAGVS